MRNEFIINGYWFFEADSYSDSTKGTLSFNPGEDIILNLPGKFIRSESINASLGTIFGYSTDEKLIILNDCVIKSNGIPAATSFYVSSFFIIDSPLGINLIENDLINSDLVNIFNYEFNDVYVSNVEFSFNHLVDIIDKHIVSFEKDYRGENTYAIVADIASYEENKIFILKEELHIEDKREITKNLGHNYKHKFTERASLKVYRNDRSLFFYYVKQIIKIKQLFEVLLGKNLSFDFVEFNSETIDISILSQSTYYLDDEVSDLALKQDSLEKFTGRYFFKENNHGKIWQSTIQKFIDFKSNIDLKVVFNNWFKIYDDLFLIIESYLRDITTTFHSEARLVNAIRNLEIYSRNFDNVKNSCNDSIPIDRSKDYLYEVNQIKEFIKVNIKERYRSEFIQDLNKKTKQYKGSNRITLKNRIIALLEKIPVSLFNKLLDKYGIDRKSSIENFATLLVDTRNFWTHGDTSRNFSNRIKENDIVTVTLELYIILRYFIFIELGIESSIASDYLIDNY